MSFWKDGDPFCVASVIIGIIIGIILLFFNPIVFLKIFGCAMLSMIILGISAYIVHLVRKKVNK